MSLHVHSIGALNHFVEDVDDSSSLFAALATNHMQDNIELLLRCTKYAKKKKLSLWNALGHHQNDILKISEDVNALSLFGDEELVPDKKVLIEVVQKLEIILDQKKYKDTGKKFTLPVVTPSARLSYSALSTYHKCGLQYYLKYGIQIPDRPGKKAVFGICIHSILENIYRCYQETKRFPSKADIDHIINTHLKSSVDVDAMLMKNMVHKYVEIYADRFPSSLFSEKGFMVGIAGVNLGGFIDLIIKHSYDEFEVIDFKSGRPQTKQQLSENIGAKIQIVLYAYAVQKLFGVLPRTVSYVYLANQTTVSFTIEREDIQWLQTFVADNVLRIQSKDFIPSVGKHCGYCSYKNICNAYDASM